MVVAISESLAERQKTVQAARPLGLEEAQEIVRQARTGAVGIPQLIQTAMQEDAQGFGAEDVC